jgi:hypothetical protein
VTGKADRRFWKCFGQLVYAHGHVSRGVIRYRAVRPLNTRNDAKTFQNRNHQNLSYLSGVWWVNLPSFLTRVNSC